MIWIGVAIAQGAIVLAIVLRSNYSGALVDPKKRQMQGVNQVAMMVYHNLTLAFYISVLMRLNVRNVNVLIKSSLLVFAYALYLFTVYIESSLKLPEYDIKGLIGFLFTPYSVLVNLMCVGACTILEILKLMIC